MAELFRNLLPEFVQSVDSLRILFSWIHKQFTSILARVSYEIAIRTGQLSTIANLADTWFSGRFGNDSAGTKKVLVIADEHVLEPHAASVTASFEAAGWLTRAATLKSGEGTKCLQVMSDLYDTLVEMQADRRTLVVAVGGGVTGDTAGFAAASYARGIPFLQVPTTLLAQVDSSVGGKTGINHPKGKNLIGAFHQPIGVLIDTQTLSTLPEREYRSGLAEVVKYGVILDENFFNYLEANVAGMNDRDDAVLRHIVARSCQLKADVVEKDEYETTGLRAVPQLRSYVRSRVRSVVGLWGTAARRSRFDGNDLRKPSRRATGVDRRGCHQASGVAACTARAADVTARVCRILG